MAPNKLTYHLSAEDRAAVEKVLANDRAMPAETASERPKRQATKRPATFDNDDSELSDLESDDEKVRDGEAALKILCKAKKPKLIVKLTMAPNTPATRKFSDSSNPPVDEADSSQPSETPAAKSSQSTNAGLLQTPGSSPDVTDTLEQDDAIENQQLLTPALTNEPPTITKQKRNSSLPPISTTAANSIFQPSSPGSRATSASSRAVGTPTRVSPRERKASVKSKESELSNAAFAQLSDVDGVEGDIEDDIEADAADDDAEDGTEIDPTPRMTGRKSRGSPNTSTSNQPQLAGRRFRRHSAEVLAPLLEWVNSHRDNLTLSKADKPELAEASGLLPQQVYDWVRKQRISQGKEQGQAPASTPRKRTSTQTSQPATKRAKTTSAGSGDASETPERPAKAKSKRTPTAAKTSTPTTRKTPAPASLPRTNQVHDTGDEDVLDPDVSPELIDLARLLHAQSQIDLPNEEKPEPIGKPSVWASGRQDLCESLPYYRALKG
ncbi:hypothetical protein LTS18_005870, partial [Coniosporium uncinatum]